MADIFEQCSTNHCVQAKTCAKKLEPDSLNVRVQKWYPDTIRGRFHCVGYEKVYGARK
jgi:hypothetical protein